MTSRFTWVVECPSWLTEKLPIYQSLHFRVTEYFYFFICVISAVLICFSQVGPLVTLWTVCLRGSSVHGILQARILEWVAMPSSRGSSSPRDRTLSSCGSCIAGRFFTAEPMTSTDSSLISYHPQKRMKYAIASNSPTNARIALWQKGLKVSEM